MANWLQQMESFIGGGPGGPRRVKAFRWLVLIGLLGPAMLLAASWLNVKTLDGTKSPDITPPRDEDTPQQEAAFIGGGDNQSSDPFSEIENQYESRLKELLETIVGVSSVTVMVTVDST